MKQKNKTIIGIIIGIVCLIIGIILPLKFKEDMDGILLLFSAMLFSFGLGAISWVIPGTITANIQEQSLAKIQATSGFAVLVCSFIFCFAFLSTLREANSKYNTLITPLFTLTGFSFSGDFYELSNENDAIPFAKLPDDVRDVRFFNKEKSYAKKTIKDLINSISKIDYQANTVKFVFNLKDISKETVLIQIYPEYKNIAFSYNSCNPDCTHLLLPISLLFKGNVKQIEISFTIK
jgi:hypothetical protein